MTFLFEIVLIYFKQFFYNSGSQKGTVMREIVLVSISALLGYIIFSAFSTSETPGEAFKKIIEQPQVNAEVSQELAFSKAHDKHEVELISLQNQQKLEELRTYEKIAINNRENETKIQLKALDNKLNHDIAVLNVEANGEVKNKDNATLIVLAFLLFLLVFVYLKYQKQLNEIELDKQDRYNEMMAKKEYAERILAHISTGNLSFETEQKLLSVLDELNGKNMQPVNEDNIYHPNPDIIQLPSNGKTRKY